MTTQTIDVGENHYVNSTAPNGVSGLSNQTHISSQLWSFYKFTLPAAPAGETLQSATLLLRTTTAATAASVDTETISLVSSTSWSESTVTWNTRPTLISTLGTIPPNQPLDTQTGYALNVATIAPLAGTTIGIAISGTTTDSMVVWSSRQTNAAYRPDLVLVYAASTYTAEVVVGVDINSGVQSTPSGLTFLPKAEMDTLYTPAPTITFSLGATSSYTSPVKIPANDSRITFRGGAGFALGTGGSATFYAPNNRYSYGWNSPPVWGYEFILPAGQQSFELDHQAAVATGSFRIKVDGKRLWDIPRILSDQTTTTGVAITGGATVVIKVTFTGVAQRRITFEGSYMPFRGVNLPTGGNITAIPPYSCRAVVLGDSITGSSSQNTGHGNGIWLPYFANYAGIDDPWNLGIGGTGYNNATPTTFINRISDVTSHNPDVVIYFGGYNDVNTGLTAQAETVFAAGLAGAPTAEHYVLGCWAPHWPHTSAEVARNISLKDAATAQGLPFLNFDTGQAYDGAGTLLGTIGPCISSTADVTAYIGTDGVHPNDAGNKHIASWLREGFILMAAATAAAPYPAIVRVGTKALAAAATLETPTITPSRNVLSKETVNITAAVPGGAVPDSWVLEQISGVTITPIGGDGMWTLTMPATEFGDTQGWRVKYGIGGQFSAYANVTFTVARHPMWAKKAGVVVPYKLRKDPPPPKIPSEGLPFRLPDIPASNTKLFMAHYYPPYPIRITNVPADGTDVASSDYYVRNYLNPVPLGASEQAHIPYGGILRTRPMPVPVHGGATNEWRNDNARREIEEAQAIGLDGFFCNSTNTAGDNYTRIIALRDIASAEYPGFIVTPMLDLSTASPLFGAPVANVAAYIASFNNKACSHYLPDGRMLIGSFQGDTQSVAWWTNLMDFLFTNHGGMTIAVAGTYNSFQAATNSHQTVLYASGQWGYGADPNVQNTSTGLAGEKAYANTRGLKNMRSIWFQDIRPFASVFDEARNTEALRAAWAKAIADNVELIQMTTYGDLKEGSDFRNTESRGRVGADISAYYAAWWKTGQQPEILRDAVYLTHRQAPLNAVPTGSQQTNFMVQWVLPRAGGRPNPSALRESVEALVFLTAASEVRVTCNGSTQTFNAPAGVSAYLKPAGLGPVKVEIWRGSVKVTDVVSPTPISNTWENDHKEYMAFGSIRGTAGQKASWPRFTTVTPPAGTTAWLPFDMPTAESLQASAAARNVVATSHPMGGFWVTPQQPASDTVADYWEQNWLYYEPHNRAYSGLTSSGSTITYSGTALTSGMVFYFTNTGGATNVTANTVYYVRNATATTFQVSATSSSAVLALGTASGIAIMKSTLHNLYGGECRDRYARRPNRPEASGVWQVKDIEWEIRAAQSAGLNAFTWGTSGRSGTEWTRLQYALKAASNHNAKPENANKKFYIIPWILSLTAITGTAAEGPTVAGQTLADLLTGLTNDATMTNGFYRRNGRIIIMPYAPNSANEAPSTNTTTGAAFFSAFDARMTANNKPIDMWMTFQSSWQTYTDNFEVMSAAMGHFGSRDHNTTIGENSSYRLTKNWLQTTKAYTYRNQAAPVMSYVAPISNQAFVPRGTPTQVGGNGILWESAGTLNFVNSWLSAIDQYVPGVLNVVNSNTWNDFAEGSQIAPTKMNGFHWLDIWAWYYVRMATGAYPTIVRDGIYLTHRKQLTSGVSYTSVQKKFCVAAGTPQAGGTYTGTAWINIFDVTVFLTAAATVEVTSGGNAPVTFNLAAGRHRVTVPLANGAQSARIVRGGSAVVSTTSPILVSATQLVQDLTYYGYNSFSNVARPVPVVAN